MTRPKTISFLSAPGGVGKTTILMCLSWFLRERNQNILLTDMDPSLGLTLLLKEIREYKKDIEDMGYTTADLLEKSVNNPSRTFDFSQFINRADFKGLTLDIIPASIRLEDILGTIWHSTTGGHREKKFKKALDYVIENKNYDYIFIDNIPCYALMYSIASLFASDYCIIPLRLTVNDLYRTIQMIRKLQKTAEGYEMSERDFYDRIYFVFNQVETQYSREEKIPDYKKELREGCPGAKFFDEFIPDRVAFRRIGTKEERSSDARKVREKFKPFYEDFLKKIS